MFHVYINVPRPFSSSKQENTVTHSAFVYRVCGRGLLKPRACALIRKPNLERETKV